MSGPDVAIGVAAFVLILIILEVTLGDWVDRHLLGADERRDARRRNSQAHRR